MGLNKARIDRLQGAALQAARDEYHAAAAACYTWVEDRVAADRINALWRHYWAEIPDAKLPPDTSRAELAALFGADTPDDAQIAEEIYAMVPAELTARCDAAAAAFVALGGDLLRG